MNRMTQTLSADYRIESSQPIASRLWPAGGATQFAVSDRALAVSLAAKSVTGCGEIRVVHVPTGEVVFRKPAPQRAEWNEEL
jgi:hypothetical protein